MTATKKNATFVALDENKIMFYNFETGTNTYHLIKEENVTIFLMDSFNACSEVVSNPDAYQLLQSKLAPVSGYPRFQSYISKYHLCVPNPVFPDESYYPPYEEVEGALIVLTLYSDPEDSSSAKKYDGIHSFLSNYKFNPITQIRTEYINHTYVDLISIDSFLNVLVRTVFYAIKNKIQPFQVCIVCGKAFNKRSNAIYCSNRCKKIDQGFAHPLQSKIESRENMIRREIENSSDSCLYDAYVKWQTQLPTLKKKFEPIVQRKIRILAEKRNVSQLSKSEINNISEVKQFASEIKDLWLEIKEEQTQP